MIRTDPAPRARRRFLYDIDGVVHIQSAVRLPELQFFATRQDADPDIVIEIGSVGGYSPRRRISIQSSGERIVYREHLGGLAANFEVRMGRPIRVVAGPLLALSRHVLYTNIVEALLRFVLVHKGRMLLHSACVGLRGQGVLLSAQTDTGKTSTILRLLSQEQGTFFSDDMTIVDAEGRASRYPKPLTISAHTLNALDINRLRPTQRAALSVQSRLHSKSGRSVGKQLARANLPIMSLNAAVQATVPPPKYMVTDLVSCIIGHTTPMDRFYIIERGETAPPQPMTYEEALDQLIANTEDAYGFPPYADLAPRLVIGGRDYDEMRAAERDILASAIRGVPFTRLRSSDFSWPAHITADIERLAQVEVTGRAELRPRVVDAGEPERGASTLAV